MDVGTTRGAGGGDRAGGLMQLAGGPLVGLIKYAYQTAGEVSGFVIQSDPVEKRTTLTGIVTNANPFLLARRPLMFVVPRKTGTWRWPIESLIVTEGHVHGTLGLFERE